MDLRIVCLACLLFSLEYVLCHPVQELPKSKQDLIRSFVEFIHDDKEISSAFEKLNIDERLIRNKRQVEETTSTENVDENGMGGERPNEGGFFDRAAKFMMEVLQRFLKWINASN